MLLKFQAFAERNGVLSPPQPLLHCDRLNHASPDRPYPSSDRPHNSFSRAIALGKIACKLLCFEFKV
ncbi:hypothetical protein PJF56_14210 [Roseofilum sp. BLCC_M91]|uniref:Uncharacterized protein n=1 Tax=Roseofilum halophilum BLCC-M91 TaxID=3022259 RepID=A0ABT7BN89_9CYAN|nr:hypothetical protein [Roseofilum halophilum]MDJ1180019.1 hypothetical protein [Roseofilum halophilum BLCC-M91]